MLRAFKRDAVATARLPIPVRLSPIRFAARIVQEIDQALHL